MKKALKKHWKKIQVFKLKKHLRVNQLIILLQLTTLMRQCAKT